MILEIIKQQEEKAREELSREVEAKDEKDLAEGKSEIDDPLEIDSAEDSKDITNKNDGNLKSDVTNNTNEK